MKMPLLPALPIFHSSFELEIAQGFSRNEVVDFPSLEMVSPLICQPLGN